MWKGLQFPGLRTQLLVVSRPQTGPAITGRTATQSLTKELSPVRCGFKPTLHVCSKKLNWNRLKSNPIPPHLALSPLCRNAEDFRRGKANSSSAMIKILLDAVTFWTNAASRACCFSHPYRSTDRVSEPSIHFRLGAWRTPLFWKGRLLQSTELSLLIGWKGEKKSVIKEGVQALASLFTLIIPPWSSEEFLRT